jgi:predicted nucleic acid-binding protein
MTPLFADAFYWIALADPNDSDHRRALTLSAELATSPIVTTDEVLTECLNFFSSAPGPFRRKAAYGVERLLASPVVRVVPQSRESFLSGMILYAARPDRGYSLTDLHLDADDEAGRAYRRPHQRPAF